MDIHLNLRPWEKREPVTLYIEEVQASVKLGNHELALSRNWLSLEKATVEIEDEDDINQRISQDTLAKGLLKPRGSTPKKR